VSFAVILQLKLCLKYFIRNIHGYIHYPTYWIYPWISIAGQCRYMSFIFYPDSTPKILVEFKISDLFIFNFEVYNLGYIMQGSKNLVTAFVNAANVNCREFGFKSENSVLGLDLSLRQKASHFCQI
jgi:hypothetical protein